MSNKEKVLAYFKEWAGKGVSPRNGLSCKRQSIDEDGTIGCMIFNDQGESLYGLLEGENESTEWQVMALILKLDKPIAAGPSKIDDQWKMYSQQLRGELTAVQQELADQKAAYNGLCEAHAMLAEMAASHTNMIAFDELNAYLLEYIETQDYGFWTTESSMVESYIVSAFNAAKNRYLMAHNKHGKISE